MPPATGRPRNVCNQTCKANDRMHFRGYTMKQGKLAATIKLSSELLIFGMTGLAEAKTIDLGALDTGNYSVTEYVQPGTSFTDHVLFQLEDALHVSTFAKSFEMSVFSFDLLGIDNFSASLEQLGSSGYQSLASLASNPVSFDDLLGPGQYRLALGGTVSGFLGGLYRVQVAAVPEADVWIMLIVGFALMLFQLHRKQKSLEQNPVAGLSGAAA